MTRLGLLVGLPWLSIRACHLFFMASPASMMASLLPRVEVPTDPSTPVEGAWYNSASMATHLQPASVSTPKRKCETCPVMPGGRGARCHLQVAVLGTCHMTLMGLFADLEDHCVKCNVQMAWWAWQTAAFESRLWGLCKCKCWHACALLILSGFVLLLRVKALMMSRQMIYDS